MPPGHGVLSGYARLLRLLSGLNNGSGFAFLAAHVNASINMPRVRELAVDPLVQLFLQRIREAEQVDRDLLRYLVLTGGPADSRRDRSILDVLWRSDPTQDPVGNLMEVVNAEQAISEIWLDGLELPPLPRSEVAYDGLPDLAGDQIFDLVVGHGAFRSRYKVGRWEQQDTPLNDVGVPLWCVDLLPPRGEYRSLQPMLLGSPWL